jgi:hypothetical protein
MLKILLDTESFLKILINSVICFTLSLRWLDPNINKLVLFFLLVSEVDAVPHVASVVCILVEREFLRCVLTNL